MNFKQWLNEMASFTLKDRFSVPCNKFMLVGLQIPCKDRPVAAVDMRFEDPQAYPPPYNKLNNGSKFSALIPGTTQYVIHHGYMDAELSLEAGAMKSGYLPLTDQQTVDKTPGAISPRGYYLIPDTWWVQAEFYDSQYQVIKPALADFNGKRKAHMTGTPDGKTPKNSLF